MLGKALDPSLSTPHHQLRSQGSVGDPFLSGAVLTAPPGPGNAYLQGLPIPMHKVGQDGRTAAADAQGGKDQDDGVELQVYVWGGKERWKAVRGFFP